MTLIMILQIAGAAQSDTYISTANVGIPLVGSNTVKNYDIPTELVPQSHFFLLLFTREN